MTVRAPSIEALTKAFPHLQPDDAKLIRSLIKLSGIYDRYRMADYIRRPHWDRLPNTVHWLDSVTYGSYISNTVTASLMAIHAINEVLGQFGVEYLNIKDTKTYRYVNTGDTYDATIIYDIQNRTWTIRSWGDIVERYDR